MSIMQTICAGKFFLPKAKIRELAQTLTSIYKHDHWAELLNENPTITQTSGQKTIEQAVRLTATTTKNTIKQNALLLKNMAQKDTYDGVGRLILKEVQVELGQISPEEILATWMGYNLKDTIEQNNNIFLIYWGGKENVEETRELRPIIWNPQRPTLEANKELYIEPPLEKDSEPANPDKILVEEVIEETGGCVEEEEDQGEG